MRRMSAIGILMGLLFTGILPVSPTQASHYELEDVLFVSPEERTAFESAGISVTDVLLESLATRKGRTRLSQKTGIASERLQEITVFTDLLQIEGVGPKMARLFLVCGITSTVDLHKRNGKTLLKTMIQMNDRYHISEILPDARMVTLWIKRAGSVPIRVKP